MKNLPWGRIAGVVARVALAVVTGVPITEEKAKRVGETDGQTKKDAVLGLVQTELELAALATGKDLSHDGDVMKAAGGIVDAIVAFHNIVAAKSITGV